jgi:diguanylate cyclase (GGDEF)-like protein
VILLLDVLDAADAVQVGNKLLAAVSRPIDTPAGPLGLSCSIGVAVCPDHGKDIDALRRQADMSMYEAKQAGRNAVVLARTEAGPSQA